MNKFFLLIAILLFPTTFIKLSAQALIAENETAIVYAMPKVILGFEVEYEKCTQEVGMFYQYSERYLGTQDVITENTITYSIKSIKLYTRTVADENRRYKIQPTKGLLTNYITLNEQGILCAINDNYEVPRSISVKPQQKEIATKSNSLMPLGEEQMLANSIGKMAEGTAKQIYRIRENRLSLLAGDVDKMPADGTSLSIVLNELSDLEQKLSELFIGKSNVEICTKNIEFTPTEGVNNHVLFRFSAHNGVVPANDLSGAPVFLTIDATVQEYQTTEKVKKIVPALYYNLPGKATVSVTYNKEKMAEMDCIIPQFGISIPLPISIFQKSDVKLQFSPETGTLLKMEK